VVILGVAFRQGARRESFLAHGILEVTSVFDATPVLTMPKGEKAKTR